MLKHKIFNTAAFLLSVFMTITLAAPTASAGWETGSAVSSPSLTAAVSAGTDQNQERPEAFRAEIIRIVNLERTNNGLAALEEIPALAEMADIRAKESAVFFSHLRPDGSSCSSIFSDYGLAYSAAGENLSNSMSSPAKLMAAWMNSENHRANILSPKYTGLGVGLYVNEEGQIYCSQLFYTGQQG